MHTLKKALIIIFLIDSYQFKDVLAIPKLMFEKNEMQI